MASLEQFRTALQRIDTATTAIAERIRALEDQIRNSGIPAETENQLVTELESFATSLEQMGRSPENPVPNEPPPAPQPPQP